MAAPYVLKLDTSNLKVLIARTSGPFGGPDLQRTLGESVRKWGVLVQTRAVWNVTGHPVEYKGGYFVIRVRTGTLRGAIALDWPYNTAFQARVFVNGSAVNPGEIGAAGVARPKPVSEYANAIEYGHDEIDLKKSLRGKIVPFFAAKAQKANGPYAARGLKPVVEAQQDYGSKWRSAQLDAKLQAKGKNVMEFTKMGGHPAYAGQKKGASTYFISFRRVGKTGWIVPAAKPRPFMGAALESTRESGRRMLVRDVKAALTNDLGI